MRMVEEVQKRYTKNDKRRADVLEKDTTKCMHDEVDKAFDLNEDISIDTDEEVKVVRKSLRFLSFHKRIKKLLPHRYPLKDRMRDITILYVDLLRPSPPP